MKADGGTFLGGRSKPLRAQGRKAGLQRGNFLIQRLDVGQGAARGRLFLFRQLGGHFRHAVHDYADEKVQPDHGAGR